jgi:hypothetical protein
MTENIQRGKGKSQGFKFDRGGVAVESGPYIGEIRNNIDPLRLGRVSVYIEEFAGPDKTDPALWRTVRYLSPFFGSTEKTGNAEGTGTYEGNQHSYGMWFTPPDIGTRVLCFFPAGRQNDGYYVGCIPEPGIGHMVPGIAGSGRVDFSEDQRELFAGATRLPVTEINNEDPAILQDPEFYKQPKPVHSVVANQLFQQGLLQDRVRGTIGTSSQRETPSSVYGVSSPGRPVYETRLEDAEIRQKLRSGEIKPEDAKVVARKGGHSFIMDDGDLDGRDQMVRIRTARGHQITMSDSGDAFYITHANGQTWLEFGKEGTVDVYSSNSINLRTQGDLNLHADENVNINAGKFLNLNAEENLTVQASGSLNMSSKNAIGISGDKSVGIRSGVTLALQSKIGSFSSKNLLSLRGGVVGLNSFPATPVLKPEPIVKYPLSESKYDPELGWQVEQGNLETIVTRAPTHEPYPQHNLGVALDTRLATSSPAALAKAQTDAIESVKDQQVDGIDIADVSLQNPAQITLGSIDSQQVTGLLAQAAKDTGQAVDEITENGLGKFAFTPDKLEEIGVLKPGSTEFFNNSDLDLETFVQNPQIWTGREGATSVETLLTNVDLQDSIQQQVMGDRFLQLQDAGLITGEEPPEQLAAFVQTATKKGVGVTKQWIESFAGGDINSTIAGVSDLVPDGLPGTLGNIPAELSGTIETIVSEFDGLDVTGLTQNISGAVSARLGDSATAITDNLSGTIEDIVSGFDGQDISGITQNITGAISDGIGNLDISGNLGGTIEDITGGIGDIAGDLGGTLEGITGDLGGTLEDITGGIGDIAGDITGNLGGTIEDITGGIGDIAGDLGGSIGDIAGDLGGTISGVTDGLTSALDGGISGITDGISGGISDLASNIGDINITAAGAQFAVNFAIQKIPALGSFFGGGGGGTGTRSPLVAVDTSDLPEAFAQASDRIIANAKVPPFTTPDDGVPDRLG